MGVSHQFDSKLHETSGFISCTYMSSSVEISSINSIWCFGQTQNYDKFLSGYNSHKKKWFQMFCGVQKFDQIST